VLQILLLLATQLPPESQTSPVEQALPSEQTVPGAFFAYAQTPLPVLQTPAPVSHEFGSGVGHAFAVPPMHWPPASQVPPDTQVALASHGLVPAALRP
jgi:hypothetical protein